MSLEEDVSATHQTTNHLCVHDKNTVDSLRKISQDLLALKLQHMYGNHETSISWMVRKIDPYVHVIVTKKNQLNNTRPKFFLNNYNV